MIVDATMIISIVRRVEIEYNKKGHISCLCELLWNSNSLFPRADPLLSGNPFFLNDSCSPPTVILRPSLVVHYLLSKCKSSGGKSHTYTLRKSNQLSGLFS